MRAKYTEWKYDGRDGNNFFFAAPGQNIKLIVYGILGVVVYVKKTNFFPFFFFCYNFCLLHLNTTVSGDQNW